MLDFITPEKIYTIGFATAIICVLVGILVYLINIWAEGLIPATTVRKLGETGALLIGGTLLVSLIAFVWSWIKT